MFALPGELGSNIGEVFFWFFSLFKRKEQEVVNM